MAIPTDADRLNDLIDDNPVKDVNRNYVENFVRRDSRALLSE